MSSVQNPFTRARISASDARIAAAALALAVRSSFATKDLVTLLKELGDQRSESTLQSRAREVLKSLCEAGILRAVETRGRRKIYSLALSRDELEKYMPTWLQKFYREILSKLESGEIRIETTTTETTAKASAATTTLDLFLRGEE